MKKIGILLGIILCTLNTFSQKGEARLGVDFDYSTKWEQSGIGVRFQYGVSDEWRISPSFNYFFEGDFNGDAFGFNFDMHRLFPVGKELKLYPILGFGFLSYDGDDNGFGPNFGAGAEFNISKQAVLFGEWKYSALFAARDQEALAIGIAVKF